MSSEMTQILQIMILTEKLFYLLTEHYAVKTNTQNSSQILHMHQAPEANIIPGLTSEGVCDSLRHFSPVLEKSKISRSL